MTSENTLRVMQAISEGGKPVQYIVGFRKNIPAAIDLANKFGRDGKKWIEKPGEPATRTIPDGKNTIHFVEVVKARKVR